jgi:hypothetical protein
MFKRLRNQANLKCRRWHVGCSLTGCKCGRDRKKEQKMKIGKSTMMGVFLAAALAGSGTSASAKNNHHFRVPPGHMPPAGKCRIWYPGTPPGHQPPPGNCRTLSRQVPRGAYLIGHDRRWDYEELRDRRFRYTDFDGDRYHGNKERYREIRELRAAQRDVKGDRAALERNQAELRKDRAELRKDIREGASRKEIAQGRREIREDQQKIAQSRREVHRSENRLEAAREDLRDNRR